MLLAPAVALALAASPLTLLGAHNAARHQAGAALLRRDPVLDATARRKAADLLRCGITHTACGHRWTLYYPARPWRGENIAVGFWSPASVVYAWLDSPDHRANVLRPQFRRIGWAHVRDVWVAAYTN